MPTVVCTGNGVRVVGALHIAQPAWRRFAPDAAVPYRVGSRMRLRLTRATSRATFYGVTRSGCLALPIQQRRQPRLVAGVLHIGKAGALQLFAGHGRAHAAGAVQQ